MLYCVVHYRGGGRWRNNGNQCEYYFCNGCAYEIKVVCVLHDHAMCMQRGECVIGFTIIISLLLDNLTLCEPCLIIASALSKHVMGKIALLFRMAVEICVE